MPPSSLHIHYVKPFKCEDFWLDPRFLVLEVVLFHLLPSRPSSKHRGVWTMCPFPWTDLGAHQIIYSDGGVGLVPARNKETFCWIQTAEETK